MKKQLDALFFLAWNLMALLFEKMFAFAQGHSNDKQQFLAQYREDHLWSMTPSQRESAPRQGGCFHCGLCEAIFATTPPKSETEESGHHSELPQSLFLGPSRELSTWPTYEMSEGPGMTSIYDAQWREKQEQLSALCPAGLSFREMREIYMESVDGGRKAE